jgi:Domain of unknown function (DUF4440)
LVRSQPAPVNRDFLCELYHHSGLKSRINVLPTFHAATHVHSAWHLIAVRKRSASIIMSQLGEDFAKRSILCFFMLLIVACWRLEQASPPSQTSRLNEGSAHKTAEGDDTAIKEALVNLEKQSWEAWKMRDGKFFQDFLSEDHLEVGFNGAATKPQIVDFVASPACVINSYSIDGVELKMLDPKIALLTYHAVQDTTCNGVPVPSPVWASSLYVKRGDRWFNAFYQQTQSRK